MKPGDQLAQPGQDQGDDKGEGGNNEGGVQLLLELKVDDIVDWLWEELKLPNLQAKTGTTQDDDYRREGWSRRGVRSRLDRRRSLKESLKRRAVDPEGPAFTDEDLRFRQLVMRRQPATQAVVFFAMDVSSSMRDRDRQLAKTFFFWVVEGLRRQYNRLELVFVAHTVKAWEFQESEFFQVRGSGGTVASSAFTLVKEIIAKRYDPSRYNVYLFYGSDGENFKDDHDAAESALRDIAALASFSGYVETPASEERALDTETGGIFKALAEEGASAGQLCADDQRVRVGGDPRLLPGTRRRRGGLMPSTVETYGSKLEALARAQGLDFYPVQFEEVPDSFMMEVAVYGLPVRMPHWSFGVRYIYQLIQHRMGHSRLFEVVFPGNPGRAYLAKGNSLQENTLVVAHVLGHADFSKHNELFRRSQQQVGYRIVDQAASHARQISAAIEEYGQERVEQVLDAALALEAHIDAFKGLTPGTLPGIRRGQGIQRRHFPAALPPAARRRAPGAAARAAQARPGAGTAGEGPALVHRAVRSGARGLGARHLPRGARGVVLFLSRYSPARS